ncbi:MAG: penicillin-binding transpeptidase domain-containing protein, partial [Acidimicrobiia bacterium]
MIRQIRALGVGLLGCFVLLFVQLNRVTVIDAAKLNDNPVNTREILRDFNSPRGTVTTADGVLLARSVPSEGRFELQREFPQGDLFGHVTGFYSFSLGSSGVEKVYNDELAGRTREIEFQGLSDLFVDQERVGNLTLTLRADLQQIAREQLGEREGSVVAIDPRDGSILALWSYPAYDPNVLSSHDLAGAAAAQTQMDADPERPRRSRAYQERFFPGSTFKVVTGSAGLVSGTVTPTEPVYPSVSSYTPPGTTRPLRNFGGSTCGGNLLSILRVSCNTSFAQMGVEVGPEAMVATAEAFGFNQDVPIDLTDPVRSNFPTDFERNLPALAQSA